MNLNGKAYKLIEGISKRVSSVEFDCIKVLDFGVEKLLDESTAWELAVAVAEASLGGLGKVRIKKGFLEVAVEENPAVACLGSQMSGWALEVGGKRALGSGPARILARKPKDVFERLNYSENSKKAVLCLESEVLPDEGVCRMVLEKTGAHELFVAAYRPDSVVGLVNVLARVVEMGVYRLNFLGYDARKIVSASGSASIPKLDENTMYSANDAIIYAGLVELKVLDWDDTLTSKCVSSSSPSYGKPFKEIFNETGGDFYKIDHAIFAPAEINVLDKKTGKTFKAGGRSWRK